MHSSPLDRGEVGRGAVETRDRTPGGHPPRIEGRRAFVHGSRMGFRQRSPIGLSAAAVDLEIDGGRHAESDPRQVAGARSTPLPASPLSRGEECKRTPCQGRRRVGGLPLE